MGTGGEGGLFCGWLLTGVRVGTLSKQDLGGLGGCSVFEGMREAGGDGGVVICSVFVMHCCSCCWETIVVAVTMSLAFSGLGATGMWCWQRVLSAVWRITLVAIALQGCVRGREGVFSATVARTGCCVDATKPELDCDAVPDDVSTKLGLWGGVIHREEKDTKSFGGSGSSDGGRESPESEAGVRGLGLQVFGFGFGFLRL